jgi:hypothetical protein
MNLSPSSRGVVMALALLAAGCGSSTNVEYPTLNGRRVQGTSVIASGAVPYRVGAYELVFTNSTDTDAHARRAALLVDLAAGQGHVRGFVEWGKSGEVPLTYVAGGWARQRNVSGVQMTVFDLALNHVDVPGARHHTLERSTPLAIRVEVDEASGDVTLTRRR